MKKAIPLLCLGLLGGCAPFVHHRGAQADNETLQKIRVGVDTQQSVRERLGSPSHVSIFPHEKTKSHHWYYIQTVQNRKAFQHPDVQDRVVFEVIFDAAGIVRSAQKLDLSQAQAVKPDGEKTATSGYETTALRDMFGNFGRYGGLDKK